MLTIAVASVMALGGTGVVLADEAVTEPPAGAAEHGTPAPNPVVEAFRQDGAMGGCIVTEGSSSERYALLVGEQDYQSKNAVKLKSSARDATDVGTALWSAFGYSTVVCANLTTDALQTAVNAFYAGVPDDAKTTTVFYFSGHGGFDGEHRVFAVDAGLGRRQDTAGLSLDGLADDLALHAGHHFILSDACRNQLRGKAGWDPGMQAPGGVYIGFASAPGHSAKDGTDAHDSPFAMAFIDATKAVDAKTTDADILMRQVRAGVMNLTEHEQIPWSNHNFTGIVTF